MAMLETLRKHGFVRTAPGVWANPQLAELGAPELRCYQGKWRCGYEFAPNPIDALRAWAGYAERGVFVDYSSRAWQARSLAREILQTVVEYGAWQP